VQILREENFEVYDFKNPPGRNGFDWANIDPGWKDWDVGKFVRALDHPLAQAGFGTDMGALAVCDACVLLLPCGRSAHLELGYAVGAGKYTAIYQFAQNEPELMYRMCNLVTDKTDVLVRELNVRFGRVGMKPWRPEL
jgi:hypothetical protein